MAHILVAMPDKKWYILRAYIKKQDNSMNNSHPKPNNHFFRWMGLLLLGALALSAILTSPSVLFSLGLPATIGAMALPIWATVLVVGVTLVSLLTAVRKFKLGFTPNVVIRDTKFSQTKEHQENPAKLDREESLDSPIQPARQVAEVTSVAIQKSLIKIKAAEVTPETGLARLPLEVLKVIISFAQAPKAAHYLSDMVSLAKTYRFFYHKLQSQHTAFAAQKLVQHVVYGEEAEAKAMLEAKPCLLLTTATVKDYSEDSPLQPARQVAAVTSVAIQKSPIKIKAAEVKPETGLARLPLDVLKIIISFTQAPEAGQQMSDMVSLAKTCLFFYHKLQPLFTAFAAQKLVQHVVYGEEAEAKAMLEAKPCLLLTTATVMDYSGRTIRNATAYQAALGAMDVDMLKMIIPFFAKLDEGKQKQISQYNAQFPEGLPTLEPYDFTELVRVISAASEDDLQAQLNLEERDSALCQAIKGFRADLCAMNVIEKGLHFNHQSLLRAYVLYREKYDGWGRPKRLFWNQVIGTIERFLPACDAQAVAQSIFCIVTRGEALKRSFKFSNDECSIFPLSEDVGLGYKFATGPFGEGPCVGVPLPTAYGCGDDTSWSFDLVAKFFDAKVSYIRELSTSEPTQRQSCT